MSSGPMDAFTDAASLALRSLCNHPHLSTADLIARGPYGLQQVGPTETREGLLELERLGLAGERLGSWVLTPAGSERCG
jgi:hypothetical protein